MKSKERKRKADLPEACFRGLMSFTGCEMRLEEYSLDGTTLIQRHICCARGVPDTSLCMLKLLPSCLLHQLCEAAWLQPERIPDSF